MVKTSDWQPIETAPKNEPIFVYGYNIQGQAAPGGPYKYWFSTVGEIDCFECLDLLQAGCSCLRAKKMETPTHWMPLPLPPDASASSLPDDR